MLLELPSTHTVYRTGNVTSQEYQLRLINNTIKDGEMSSYTIQMPRFIWVNISPA